MNLTKHWTAQLDDYVIDLAWSPYSGAQLSTLNSQLFLGAASGAGPVSIFSGADGARQHELPGHENGTNCLAWQPVGRVIPNAPTSTEQTERRIKDNPPYLLSTGGQDGAVKFWDAASGQHTATASLGKAWV